MVHVQAVYHVDDIDEKLCTPHALQEIAWPTHFRHELNKNQRAAVRVDSLHEAVDGRADITGIRKAPAVLDGGIATIGVWSHDGRVDAVSSRRNRP